MAQHDYTIANQGFPATRADINNVLSAISTNNSGTSAPSTQYAGQFWIDTTSSTWTMYIHDGADDIQFATIDTSANTINFTDSALDVVTDTTPQLGGNLDLNSSDITGTGNIDITGDITASGNLLVDTIEPQSGTTLTLGASGDTITIPSGATIINNGTDTGFGLTIASTAEAQAQTSDTVTISPLKLAQAFLGSNQNIGNPGYQILPGGLIIQWLYHVGPTTGNVIFTYPIAFPNAVLSAVCTPLGNVNTTYSVHFKTISTTVANAYSATNNGRLFIVIGH